MMDTGKGYMKEMSETELRKLFGDSENIPNQTETGGIFREGEELEIRGSKFRVRKITKKDIILKVLKQ